MKKLELSFPELPFAIEEALNRLRVNIRFCGQNTKKIMITSTLPDEGKSVVAVNLWKMLAEAGLPTVLLDADLRKSTLNRRHGIREEELAGVDYFLSGQAEYQDIVYETNVENGYLVPITNHLENPSILFEDERFKELLDRLAQDYRYVIIDTPPIMEVADGAIIAGLCDGTVYVVRAGFVSRKIIRQSLTQIELTGCKLLGMVLNRVETSGKGYGYYGKKYGYGYGYGRKYGYGYGEGSRDGK